MTTIVEKPNLYDLLYDNLVEDIPLYLTLLRDCHEILEFGAGTGRVTIPLAKEGHLIEAIDIEKRMIDTFKLKIKDNNLIKRRIKLVVADMCNYRASKKYDAVIIPLTSFNYLLTEREELNCLKAVCENLKDNGFALIELLSEKTYLDTNINNDFQFVKRLTINETSFYDYYRITQLDLKDRKINQRRLFKLYINNKFVSEEELIWKNRFVTIEDFEKLSEKSGLYIEKIYGNCSMDAYTKNSEDIFIKVRK